MFHLVLYQPEIPPNTGNIIRLSANIGATLHLIHPLGFDLSDRQLRRAGMDYRDLACVREHARWDAFLSAVRPSRFYLFTTSGCRCHVDAEFVCGDALVFGSESRGLPRALLDSVEPDRRLFLPMLGSSRSLNLSNAVAVAAYEAWRQIGFAGAVPRAARGMS